MLTTEEGISIDFSELQPINAISPILVTEEGIMIDFSELQLSANCLFS